MAGGDLNRRIAPAALRRRNTAWDLGPSPGSRIPLASVQRAEGPAANSDLDDMTIRQSPVILNHGITSELGLSPTGARKNPTSAFT
jgi:hypothetical protein